MRKGIFVSFCDIYLQRGNLFLDSFRKGFSRRLFYDEQNKSHVSYILNYSVCEGLANFIHTMKKLLLTLFKVNWLKTIYFNLHYLSFSQAILLPVFIYNRTYLYKMKGKITFNCPLRPGLVKIGPHGLGTRDRRFSRTMWEVTGELKINGKASFGRGCRISIGKQAILEIGRSFCITGDTSIICQKKIHFGDDCLLSWDILIMDTDFHHISNKEGKIINEPRPIEIGNHVWIGCRNTLLKGITIADHTIIAASSTITQSNYQQNCVIGGHGKGMQILKKDVSWES